MRIEDFVEFEDDKPPSCENHPKIQCSEDNNNNDRGDGEYLVNLYRLSFGHRKLLLGTFPIRSLHTRMYNR